MQERKVVKKRKKKIGQSEKRESQKEKGTKGKNEESSKNWTRRE